MILPLFSSDASNCCFSFWLFLLPTHQPWVLSKVVLGPYFLLSLWFLSPVSGFQFVLICWVPCTRSCLGAPSRQQIGNRRLRPWLRAGEVRSFSFFVHFLASPAPSQNPWCLADSCLTHWEWWPPDRTSLNIYSFYFNFSLHSLLFFLFSCLRRGRVLSEADLDALLTYPGAMAASLLILSQREVPLLSTALCVRSTLGIFHIWDPPMSHRTARIICPRQDVGVPCLLPHLWNFSGYFRVLSTKWSRTSQL